MCCADAHMEDVGEAGHDWLKGKALRLKREKKMPLGLLANLYIAMLAMLANIEILAICT